ncbi:MAG: AtpZ/AtpI family protein [Flavobacteriaceae bacterium]|nr:AtpZ/AtpI family protein [Flavobacteriaceae bacterium]
MPDQKNNGLKRWAALSAIAIEMGVIIYVFVRFGKWLDTKYNPEGKLFIILCTLAGLAISLFLVIKQTNKLNS